MTAAQHDEDSDLHDLVNENGTNENGVKSPPMEAFETEKLVSDKTKRPPDEDVGDQMAMPDLNPFGKICLLLQILFLLATTRPNVTLCVGVVLTVVLVVALIHGATKVVDKRAYAIANDYSNIDSIYDLKLGRIDHWCIFGGDDGCTCNDPLLPISHGELPGWMKAHKANKRLIEYSAVANRHIDVAFLGDSITEEWGGRWVGRNNTKFSKIAKTFNKHFTKDGGGKYEGIPVGIAGDTSPNILWRIMHGEMPFDFNPRVWWLLVGINDLAKEGCSGEVTLLGILRVIEEIQARKPNAIIVINGILPTAAVAHKRGKPGVVPKKNNKKDEVKDSEDVEATDEKEKGFMHEPQKEVLPTTRVVNRELQRFSEKHPRVKYFDAGDIFYVKDAKGKGMKLDKSLFRDGVHPTDQGHALWAEAIEKRLETIFAKEEEEEAEEFVPPQTWEGFDDDLYDDFYFVFDDDLNY